MGYRQPAPDPNGSRTGGRYEWLKCGTHQSPLAICWCEQNDSVNLN